MKTWTWVVGLLGLFLAAYLIDEVWHPRLDRIVLLSIFFAVVMVLLADSIRSDIRRVEDKLDTLIDYVGVGERKAPLREILETAREVRLIKRD